jgi:hypothetical protein
MRMTGTPCRRDGCAALAASRHASCSVLVLAGALVACAGHGMTKAKARELQVETLQRYSALSCSWDVVEPGTDAGGSTFIDAIDTAQHHCARELEAAGVLKIGACLEGSSSDSTSCLYREVLPRAGSVVTKQSVVFACGTFKNAELESMETDGDGAVTLHYTRTFEEASILKSLAHCGWPTLRKPDAGRLEKKQTYRRASDGRWEPFMGEAGSAWLY